MPRPEGPFQVLERVNDNAYKIDFPSDFQVFSTFNFTDLGPNEDDDNMINLRSNFAKQGEDDGGTSWTSSESQKTTPNRQDLGLAVVEENHLWHNLVCAINQLGFVCYVC